MVRATEPQNPIQNDLISGVYFLSKMAIFFLSLLGNFFFSHFEPIFFFFFDTRKQWWRLTFNPRLLVDDCPEDLGPENRFSEFSGSLKMVRATDPQNPIQNDLISGVFFLSKMAIFINFWGCGVLPLEHLKRMQGSNHQH